jgi:signal transduction histidine kinase
LYRSQDVRKVETGELHLEQAPFPLSDVVSDARVFKVTAERKGIAFIEDVQPYFEGLVLADRLRLRQILANALSNAVKFTSKGTSLSPLPFCQLDELRFLSSHQKDYNLTSVPSLTGSVTLALRQIDETRSKVTVEFVVQDTGVGISKDVLPTLFKPFRFVFLFLQASCPMSCEADLPSVRSTRRQADASTARQYGGSGLGLTIAKQVRCSPFPDVRLPLTTLLLQLVELMGGSISLSSAGANLGSRMTVRVPLRKAPANGIPCSPSPNPSPAAEQRTFASPPLAPISLPTMPRRHAEDVKVLLAEDNSLIREIVMRTLKRMKVRRPRSSPKCALLDLY